MGYDIYVCDREGQTVQTNYEDDNYLRRNIFGMGPLREALVSAGMAYAATAPTGWGDFPDAPHGEGHYDGDYEPISEEAKLYQKQLLDVLRRTGDERPGIPLHKLCDNSGWWVTHTEVQSALAMWERVGNPMPEEFRDDLIPFLRQAAAHGGFRVY